jgi:hypothetical protein
MRSAAEAGKLQLKNAQPAGLSGSKKNFAVSTHFAITSSAKSPAKSTTFIIDPPAEVIEVEDTAPADLLVRCAYAKACRYADNDLLADLLLGEENWPISTDVWRTLDRSHIPIGFAPFGSSCD